MRLCARIRLLGWLWLGRCFGMRDLVSAAGDVKIGKVVEWWFWQILVLGGGFLGEKRG